MSVTAPYWIVNVYNIHSSIYKLTKSAKIDDQPPALFQKVPYRYIGKTLRFCFIFKSENRFSVANFDFFFFLDMNLEQVFYFFKTCISVSKYLYKNEVTLNRLFKIRNLKKNLWYFRLFLWNIEGSTVTPPFYCVLKTSTPSPSLTGGPESLDEPFNESLQGRKTVNRQGN